MQPPALPLAPPESHSMSSAPDAPGAPSPVGALALSGQQWSHTGLAAALREALQLSLDEAPRFDPPPSIDLAVVAFDSQRQPIWANVRVDRGHHAGVVARIDGQAGSVQDIQTLVDPTDAQRRSLAWQPGADWTQFPDLQVLAGSGPYRAIAPYPASLIKLMVAVGVGLAFDSRGLRPDSAHTWGGRTRSVHDWAFGMITESRNDDTSALVALLHQQGLIVRRSDDSSGGTGVEVANALHTAFAARGLHTLRMANTRPDGGWLNRDGAGVGHLQMTAWDTVRLLWLLLPAQWEQAPPAPWPQAQGAPLLSTASAAWLWGLLREQALHHVLSTSALGGAPGWEPGIPARLPERWLDATGRVRAEGLQAWADLRPLQADSPLEFAHKTGTTENYLSDAGWVWEPGLQGRRYLIALLSTLGSRHAPGPGLAAPWCIPRIGARLDAWLKRHAERRQS